jgi:hypothetical protein
MLGRRTRPNAREALAMSVLLPVYKVVLAPAGEDWRMRDDSQPPLAFS